MGIDTKARKKINSKKRYGIRQNITKYYNEIVDTFYNEKLLEEKLNKYLKQTGQENLNDTFIQYLNEVNQNIKKLLEKAKELLIDSWKKGTERIQDQDGNTIKFDEEIDENAIKLLAREQERNYKSLTKQQTKAVNNTISKGLEQGKSYEEIANDIKSKVKTITKSSAMRIARSEIVSNHSIGQLQTMQKARIKYYSFINSPDYTGKDGKTYPCKICRKLQGSKGRERIYEVDKAGTSENPLPVMQSHASCQCLIVVRTDKQ
jgi:SPP1 gp7 family putative phage head morphogenesis protein